MALEAEIAARLTKARGDKGWSRRELSRKSGVPLRAIERLERARRALYISETFMICRALGLSAPILFLQACAQVCPEQIPPAVRKLEDIPE